MFTRTHVGRALLTLIAVFTIVSPYLADWNVTHIYNPHWPPHAKFHNGQTMAVAVIMGAAALWFLWRKSGDATTNLLAALLFDASYWLSQMAAFLFPGVAYTDPEFLGPSGPAALPPQLILEVIVLSLVALGGALIWSGRKR